MLRWLLDSQFIFTHINILTMIGFIAAKWLIFKSQLKDIKISLQRGIWIESWNWKKAIAEN